MILEEMWDRQQALIADLRKGSDQHEAISDLMGRGGREMKGKCEDCPAFVSHLKYCQPLAAEVEPWWTGCKIDADRWVKQHPEEAKRE